MTGSLLPPADTFAIGAARASLDDVMRARRSTRAFLPTPVAEATVAEVIELASRAPSGNNIQPWRVHVVAGEVRERLVAAVCQAYDAAHGASHDASASEHRAEYDYYPREFFEPYLGRRRKNGWGLYGLLGIGRGDAAAMRAQQRRNFEFFGAPVGLMFTIDRRLGQGSWIDYGMFLQNLMLAAQSRGLATCAQAAWNDYHRIIGQVLGFAAHEQLVCGMALGHADPHAVVNGLHTERAPLAEFVVSHGFAAGQQHSCGKEAA